MPHRAGYFVLAYNWDHHCSDLAETIKTRFGHLYCELESLALPQRNSRAHLIAYLSNWQSLQERFQQHIHELDRRCQTIHELGQRGYGTNRDLLQALQILAKEQRAVTEPIFHQKFEHCIPRLPKKGSIPKEVVVARDVKTLVTILGSPTFNNTSEHDIISNGFGQYFQAMSKTPWVVNTSIFQKLFLKIGAASMTLMQGKVGLSSPRPARELKITANRNFMEMYRESFASLHLFSEIGLDFLKHIHWVLSKGIYADAGHFRTIDFPDRNGVTTEFNNLSREIGNLTHVLRETARSFHDLPKFIWDLARSYYMFIGIHPFSDSNGRVGRIFLNHMLLKKGIPPIGFHDKDEIFALPRYGGTMEDMHQYLLRRISLATEDYFRERTLMESAGRFDKDVYNISFDSGCHFQQIDDNPQHIEVHLPVYIAPEESPEAKLLINHGKIVLSNEELLPDFSLYCGLTDTERGDWKHTLGLIRPRSSHEISSDVPATKSFELRYAIDFDKEFSEHEYLCCSAVSPSNQQVFSNQGAYYSLRLEKRHFTGIHHSLAAERYAFPSYKWLNARRMLPVTPHGLAVCNPGGIGFSFMGGAEGMSLKVLLQLWRADGASEHYLCDAYRVHDFGGDWQQWQTHRLPLLPWDGPHGHVTYAVFSYLIHRSNQALVSQNCYKFATFAEFSSNSTDRTDFFDPCYKTENPYTLNQVDAQELQAAYDRVCNSQTLDMEVRFTRGNPGSPEHPVNEIHREIDRVIAKKKDDPQGRHWIHLALFDLDNYHIAEHLIYAKNQGVEVECLGDWAGMSALNRTDNIARIRKAGIPVLGIVRNTPGVPSEGIGSMHTKIFIFDGEVVHSSSYNLHFHLWGGNREEVMIFRSPEIALLHENIFQAIRGGIIQPLQIDPLASFNLYYSFGYTITKEGKLFRAQDAILTEIHNAQKSIEVCMFDIGFLVGTSLGDSFESDVVSALIHARNRGIRVKVILNGQIAHTGQLPASWDKKFRRPLKPAAKRLKDAWVDVSFLYYHESVYSPLHHKIAVIDGHTSVIGSYNWYEASLVSDEVVSVIRNRQLAKTLSDEIHLIEKSYRLEKE